MVAAVFGLRPSLAIQVIPPRTTDERDVVILQVMMQSLVLDKENPVTLEITGEQTAKRFILRATRAASLDHVEAQIRLRYPQADIRPLLADQDPWRLGPKEGVSVIELRPGAPSYLPYQDWQESEWSRQGTDPLLGVLASLTVPEGLRAITQIALVPASPTWSKNSQRRAVEHSLEPERAAERLKLAQARVGEDTLSWTGVILLGVTLAALVLFNLYRQAIPPWLLSAGAQLLFQGRLPRLTGAEQSFLFLWGGVLIVVLAALSLGIGWVKRRFFARPLYDQQLVQQNTMRMAYHTKIRLYVIGPGMQFDWKRKQNEALLLPAVLALQAALTITHALWETMKYLFSMRKMTRRWPDRQQLSIYWRRTCHLPAWQQIKDLLDAHPLPTKQEIDDEEKWRKEQDGRRQDILLSLVAAYRQYHLALAGYFLPHKVRPLVARQLMRVKSKKKAVCYGWQDGLAASKHMVTVAHLASLWHMPYGAMLQDLALVEHRRSRTLLVPAALIAPQRLLQMVPQLLVGISEHAGYSFPFAITDEFLQTHSLIGGKSGEGKSTFLLHIAMKAMFDGKGFCLVDPHGDLAKAVLERVPPALAHKVIFLDLAEVDAIGLNPLDVTLGRDRDKAIADVIATFKNIWKDSWGPRMENAFTVALRTAFDANQKIVERDEHNGPDNQYTLLDVMYLVVDEGFCHDVLKDVDDMFVHRWWLSYYEPLNMTQRRDVVNPVISKLSSFESKIARRIVGQGRSTINFKKMIADQNIVLVSLAKGVAGDDVSALVGATFLGFLTSSLAEQSALDPDQRVSYSILVDEFQAVPGARYPEMMAELRKYRVSATLATQSFEYIYEVDKTLLPAILANIRQLVLYRMSARDAETIHRELSVEPEDIINLDAHVCYVKMSRGHAQQPTFSLRMMLPPAGDPRQALSILARSRREYTRNAADIDKHLLDALVRNIRASTDRAADQNNANSANGADASAQATGSSSQNGPPKKTRGRKSEEDRFGKPGANSNPSGNGSGTQVNGNASASNPASSTQQGGLFSMELEAEEPDEEGGK